MKCRNRRYADEATAKRALWAMGLNGRDTSKLTVQKCQTCHGWHMVKVKR